MRQVKRGVDSLTVRLVLSLGMVLGIGATGTFAAWTDTAAVSGTTLGTATVDLTVNNRDTDTAFRDLDATLAPGSSTSGVLRVRNNGNVPLNYYVNAAASNADGKGLGAALTVRVTGANNATGSLPNETCAGTTLANTATSFGPNLVGSASSTRSLAVGASETLCIEATLPASTPTSMQGASTNISFTVPATTPATAVWTDSVAVSGSTVNAATIAPPVVTCGTANATQVKINWTSPPGATGFRVFYGPGGASQKDVPSTTTSEDFRTISSGTFWVNTLFGVAAWTSGNSNSVTYDYNGTATSTCS